MRKAYILPALLLVMAMFAAAEYSGQKEIIFPEIAALALGAWVMEKPPWRSSILDFWLSPTMAAVSGVLMVRFFTYAPFFMITGAFCLVVLQLRLIHSGVLPSISAAILAIITRTDSWYYPLSVCVLTGMIALGRYALDRCAPWNDPTVLPRKSVPDRIEGNGTLNGLAHWSNLLAGVVAVTAVAAVTDHLFMVAPPLIVAFVEVSKPGGALRDRTGKILGLLVFAALSGVMWYALIHTVLGWPLTVSAAVSTLTVFLAYHILQLPFPPAVAIALLPAILPQGSLWSYPWQVLCGSAAFMVISKLCIAHAEHMAVPEGTPTE
ncbi:MAG: hypothetical protein HXX11_11835 [Desulfuromonadales bacterium]|nr:hypothetical protein [Desulfuromonadales bacterium]